MNTTQDQINLQNLIVGAPVIFVPDTEKVIESIKNALTLANTQHTTKKETT